MFAKLKIQYHTSPAIFKWLTIALALNSVLCVTAVAKINRLELDQRLLEIYVTKTDDLKEARREILETQWKLLVPPGRK